MNYQFAKNKLKVAIDLGKVSIFLTLLLILLFPQVAKAEWDWTDKADLKRKFETTISEHLSKSCASLTSPPVFHYQTTDAEDSEISYQISFSIDRVCFQRLVTRLNKLLKKNQLTIVSSKKPIRLFSKYNADSGPTLVFYFSATAADIRNANNQR